jgi:hypothetical protein
MPDGNGGHLKSSGIIWEASKIMTSDKFLFGQEQFERRLKMARKFGAFLIATKTFLA